MKKKCRGFSNKYVLSMVGADPGKNVYGGCAMAWFLRMEGALEASERLNLIGVLEIYNLLGWLEWCLSLAFSDKYKPVSRWQAWQHGMLGSGELRLSWRVMKRQASFKDEFKGINLQGAVPIFLPVKNTIWIRDCLNTYSKVLKHLTFMNSIVVFADIAPAGCETNLLCEFYTHGITCAIILVII